VLDLTDSANAVEIAYVDPKPWSVTSLVHGGGGFQTDVSPLVCQDFVPYRCPPARVESRLARGNTGGLIA
jgi:hypothetical protein